MHRKLYIKGKHEDSPLVKAMLILFERQSDGEGKMREREIKHSLSAVLLPKCPQQSALGFHMNSRSLSTYYNAATLLLHCLFPSAHLNA